MPLQHFIEFPINRCHQRVVTFWDNLEDNGVLGIEVEFPINRCHQRVVALVTTVKPLPSHVVVLSNQ